MVELPGREGGAISLKVTRQGVFRGIPGHAWAFMGIQEVGVGTAETIPEDLHFCSYFCAILIQDLMAIEDAGHRPSSSSSRISNGSLCIRLPVGTVNPNPTAL